MFLAHTRGTNNQAHAIGNVEGAQRIANLGAVIPFNSAGYSARLGVVWHQHQVAAGEAHIGGEGGAFIATLFLFHLYDDFGAFGNQVLDGGFVVAAGILLEVLPGNLLQRQESMALGTEIHESGFQAGFHSSHLAFIDIGFLLDAGAVFDIEVVEALTVDECYPEFLFLGGVD